MLKYLDATPSYPSILDAFADFLQRDTLTAIQRSQPILDGLPKFQLLSRVHKSRVEWKLQDCIQDPQTDPKPRYFIATPSSFLNAPVQARSCHRRASSHSGVLRQPE